MAHIAKATPTEVTGLLNHDSRAYANHSNEDIDPTLSSLNLSFVEGDPQDRYKKRMSEVYCLNRADVNTLACIVLTLPADVKKEDHHKFFLAAHSFYADYFGLENTVSSIVHFDESTPHLHYKAIPVYFNDKKQRYQVSFKEKVPKQYFVEMHEKLNNHIKKALGYEVSIMNESTREGNQTVQELKQLTKTKQLETLKEEIEQISQEKENELIKLSKLRKIKEINNADLNIPKKEIKENTILGKPKIEYSKYEEVYEQLVQSKTAFKEIQIKNKQLESENETLIRSKTHLEVSRNALKEEIGKLSSNKLFIENKGLKCELEQIKKENSLLQPYKEFLDTLFEKILHSKEVIKNFVIGALEKVMPNKQMNWFKETVERNEYDYFLEDLHECIETLWNDGEINEYFYENRLDHYEDIYELYKKSENYDLNGLVKGYLNALDDVSYDYSL